MYLKPSNLFYSHNSITYVFREDCAHSNVTIGNTLDDLCEGRCKISEIPPMRVTKKDGKWYSLDNRRLWLFHHLEAAGKCEKVPVKDVKIWVRPFKLTTENGGTSITIVRESPRKRGNRPMVRESPGGTWHTKLIPVTPRIEGENCGKIEIKPSNIFYSHDTIMYRFRKKWNRFTRRSSKSISIGDTLDDLCDGSCKISDIPRITITKKDGKWHTLDNRRLWVFHHYEAHLNTEGKSLTITADVVEYNPSDHDERFTTKNGGESIVVVKGSPWGKKQIVPVTPRVVEQSFEKKESENNVASEKRIGETKDEPIITDEIDDDSLVLKDKIASFSENSFGLSIGNTDINIGFSASRKRELVEDSKQSSEEWQGVKRFKTYYE